MNMQQKSEALLKWFQYKNDDHGPDNDVCLEHISEYAALYGFPKEWIYSQGKNEQYEIHFPKSKEDTIFRGDTLTSVWTRLNGCLQNAAVEERFTWNEEMFNINSKGVFTAPPWFNECFKNYLSKLMCMDSQICKHIENLTEKRAQLLADMCKALPASFFDFMVSSQDSGNLIMCPMDFNSPRGMKNVGKNDTKDYVAFCFARYFKTRNIRELEKLGTSKLNIDNLLEYFNILGIRNLEQCKEKLFLQDLFDESGRVISLKTGKGIPEDCENYDPHPQTKEQYDCFFRLDAEIIRKRTKRIQDALEINTAN